MSRFLILSLLCFAWTAKAQDTEQRWENLQALRAGHKIQVVETNLRSQDGLFVGVSDETLTFQIDNQEINVRRGDVFRVSSREHLGRGTKALMGLVLGAAAGAVTGALAFAHDKGGSGFGGIPNREQYIGAGMFLFGGVGAGIGALLPSGHPVIYCADRRNP
jgi:hypothetical protein